MKPSDENSMKRAIQCFFRDLGPYIDYIFPEGMKFHGHYYAITLELKVTGISELRGGVPIEKDQWLLNVKISQNYPAKPAECTFLAEKDYKKPFHPHVKRGDPFFRNKGGQWVEYLESRDEDILDLILRICRSLQYTPEFIQSELPKNKLGNTEAMDWYKTLYNQNSDTFPWDKTPIIAFEVANNQNVAEDIRASSSDTPNSVRQSNEEKDAESEAKAKSSMTKDQKRKFSIAQTSAPYKPIIKIKPPFVAIDELKSDNRTGASKHELYILNKAHEIIFNHIEWSADSPFNKVEQGGLLVGEVFEDPNTTLFYGVVEVAVPAQSANGTTTHLTMDHESWKEMTDLIDKEYGDKQIIGWYHTHPNQLDVYMSEEDLKTQQTMFPNDWQFAIILNPHKSIWRAFQGFEANECQGFIVAPGEYSPIIS